MTTVRYSRSGGSLTDPDANARTGTIVMRDDNYREGGFKSMPIQPLVKIRDDEDGIETWVFASRVEEVPS